MSDPRGDLCPTCAGGGEITCPTCDGRGFVPPNPLVPLLREAHVWIATHAAVRDPNATALANRLRAALAGELDHD